MHLYATPALYCLFVWWFATGAIVLMNNLPRKTFPYSMGVFSAIAGVSLYRLGASSQDVSVAGAYAAFTYGVLVWGWHEMAFFMGFLTGPRKIASPPGVGRWRKFAHGVAACLDHELAIIGTAVAVLWLTWGAPNQVGMWTFMALWGMRQSAKLNVFLGVRNLGEAFLPAHLTYLFSFMTRRRMNWLMPVSIGAGSLLVALLWMRLRAPGTTAVQAAGLTCLVTMLALAVIEHAMLVLPLPFTDLWSWFLRLSGRAPPPPPMPLPELPPAEPYQGAWAADAHAEPVAG